MSDDPETRRQIAALAQGVRPLIVCDVDEVVLEFVRPFRDWLGTQDLLLKTDSFRLHGNIVGRNSGEAVENAKVSSLIEAFFACQHEWQEPVAGAIEHMALLSQSADIVLLTAMPHRHREKRMELMERTGIGYPLITTEMAKGPAVRALRGSDERPVVFIDDIAHNHISVAASVPEAALIHLMAFTDFLPVMPPLPNDVFQANGWPQAAARAADHFAMALQAKS